MMIISAKKGFIFLSVAAIIAMTTGCASSIDGLDKENKNFLNKIPEYKNAGKKLPSYRQKAKNIVDKKIDVSFYQESVYDAVRKTAEYMKIGFDESFVPDEEYKITIDYNGDLGGFLDAIYRKTGVHYKYRNNMLSVVNKEIVNVSIKGKQCPAGKNPNIIISLKDASPTMILKYFSDEFGFGFSYNTRYYDLGEHFGGYKRDSMSSKQGIRLIPHPNTSFFYKGCDKEEALRMYLKANNLSAKKIGKNQYEVRDYEILNVDLPTYFGYTYQSGAQLGGTEDGGGAVGGAKVSIREDISRTFTYMLKSNMSREGILNVSNRGYASILDHPNRTYAIRSLVNKEIRKQIPMMLSIAIIRVDRSDRVSTGMDYDLLVKGLLHGKGSANLKMSYAPEVGGGLSISGLKDGLTQSMSILQEFGDAKIVRRYNVKARAGILSTFKAVDQIPYVTTTVTTTSAGSETNGEAKFAEAGLIVNVLPTVSNDWEAIDLSTNIVVSEYLGDKKFNISGSEYKLPQITSNEVQLPGHVHMGESVILTGFNLKNAKLNKKGVPKLSQEGTFGRLFGLNDEDNKVTDFIIVITPKPIKDY